jgi:hypothetical protein
LGTYNITRSEGFTSFCSTSALLHGSSTKPFGVCVCVCVCRTVPPPLPLVSAYQTYQSLWPSRVAALNVAGTGLSEVLQEFLSSGAGDGLDGGDAYLGYSACEGALKAVLMTAKRLASAGLLEIEITAPMSSSSGVEGGSFGEQGEQRNGVQEEEASSSAWSDAHSLLLLCLVARNCGATDEEAVHSVVQPLQFDGACRSRRPLPIGTHTCVSITE